MLHFDAKILLFLQVFVVIGLPLFLWRPLRLGQFFPLPIIQILAGIMLGPSIFGALSAYLADTYGMMDVFKFLFKSELSPGLTAKASIATLANVATVLFIFLAGCEADRGIIQKSAGMVLKIGTSGVFLPWILGTLAASLLVYLYAGQPGNTVLGPKNLPLLYSVAFGLCMAVSALPVLVVVLRELGFNQKPIGTIALAIGGIDDGLLWLSLAILLPLAAASEGNSAILGAAIAFGGLIVTVALLHYALAPFMDWLIAGEAEERVLMSTLIVVLFFAAGVTELTGLHAAMGAFVTGLLLPDKIRHLAQDRLDSPVNLLLLPFLFLSTGLNTNFSFSDPTVWVIYLVAMVVCVGGKFVGISIPAFLSGQSRGFAITLAVLLQCKGLMEIVVITILRDKQVIGEATFSALVLTALTSTAMTVPLARLCLRAFGEEATTPRPEQQRAVEVAVPNLPTVSTPAEAAPAAPAFSGPTLVFEEEFGTFPLTKPEFVIGRHSQDDIRLNDIRVSRHHAKMREIAGGRYEIDNLTAVRSEPNPVLVNGVPKEHAVLADGDVVTLGGLSFTFHQPNVPAEARPEAATVH